MVAHSVRVSITLVSTEENQVQILVGKWNKMKESIKSPKFQLRVWSRTRLLARPSAVHAVYFADLESNQLLRGQSDAVYADDTQLYIAAHNTTSSK